MTKAIPLTRGKVALVDDEDYPALALHRWYYGANGYAAHHLPRRRGETSPTVLMHRVILQAPDGIEIDHRNGDRLDNRKANLRLATDGQNTYNRRPSPGTSQYKGVQWSKQQNRWKATIQQDRRVTHLGFYDTERDAALAYDVAASVQFGEFAYLNFGAPDTATIKRYQRPPGRFNRPKRLPRGVDHHQAKLTVTQVQMIRERSAAGEFQRALAKEFGLGQSTVSDIVSGKTWTHLVPREDRRNAS